MPAQQTPPATPPAATQSLLKIFGSGSKSTQKFTAAGDWDLAWDYDCTNFGQAGYSEKFFEWWTLWDDFRTAVIAIYATQTTIATRLSTVLNVAETK